jgi:hypothetical protein
VVLGVSVTDPGKVVVCTPHDRPLAEVRALLEHGVGELEQLERDAAALQAERSDEPPGSDRTSRGGG